MKDVKDMFKFVNKKKMLLVFGLGIIYNLSVYGASFALSHYVTSPLTITKLLHLLVCLVVLYCVSLILRWIYVKVSQVFLYKMSRVLSNSSVFK